MSGCAHRYSVETVELFCFDPPLFFCRCRECGNFTDACLTPEEAKVRIRAGWYHGTTPTPNMRELDWVISSDYEKVVEDDE